MTHLSRFALLIALCLFFCWCGYLGGFFGLTPAQNGGFVFLCLALVRTLVVGIHAQWKESKTWLE